MNLLLLRHLLTIVGIFAAAAASADDKAIPSYVTTKEITAMAPRTGTLAKRISEYSCSFTTADGKEFILGSPIGEQWVWHFLVTLKVGQACKLPETFQNYMNAPGYGTAREIAAMTPCTGTLVGRSPCSSHFTTADGKYFGIGNPGSEAVVSHFIWSLKDGQTCKLPDAFLEYQKQNPDKKQ